MKSCVEFTVLGWIIRHGEQYAGDSARELAYVETTLKSIRVYVCYESVQPVRERGENIREIA